jgi:low temperature requirement protein LtrA
VERHGLIIIIALGESIVAIGVGAAGLELGAGVVLAAVLGMILAAGLWWTYFDYVALAAERRLISAQGQERATLARDSYSYLHLPMVAGIVWSLWVSRRPWLTSGTLRGSSLPCAVRRRRALPPRAQRLSVARRG